MSSKCGRSPRAAHQSECARIKMRCQRFDSLVTRPSAPTPSESRTRAKSAIKTPARVQRMRILPRTAPWRGRRKAHEFNKTSCSRLASESMWTVGTEHANSVSSGLLGLI